MRPPMKIYAAFTPAAVKVGRTTRAVTDRVAEIQQTCPDPLRIYRAVVPSDQHAKVELRAHESIIRDAGAEAHLHGEWFTWNESVRRAIDDFFDMATQGDAAVARCAHCGGAGMVQR